MFFLGLLEITLSNFWEPADPKFQVEGRPPTNYSFCQKTRLVWYKNLDNLSSILSQCTCLTDRRTDSFLLTRPPCIQCSVVKVKLRDMMHVVFTHRSIQLPEKCIIDINPFFVLCQCSLLNFLIFFWIQVLMDYTKFYCINILTVNRLIK